MPRNVRNWWAWGRADGSARAYEFGPQAREGGISIDLKARDRGEVVDSFRIEGLARGDGTLTLTVYGPDGDAVARHVTHR